MERATWGHGVLSCDKRRIILWPSVVVDLEQQSTIAAIDCDVLTNAGDVTTCPTNPDIFVSISDKLRVMDLRMGDHNGRVKPVQLVDIPNRLWTRYEDVLHMKDQHSVWMGSDSLLRIDLRSSAYIQYDSFAVNAAPKDRDVLIDPVECRAVEFANLESYGPLLRLSDLSGEEWTHTIHTGAPHTSGLLSSLNSTQLACVSMPTSSVFDLYVYDL
jgi:hypothetical protein